MRPRRKRQPEVTGMRLAPDAKDLLDREAERSGRYPASIVSDLIRIHLPARESGRRADVAAPLAVNG